MLKKKNKPKPLFFSTSKKGGEKIKIRQSASQSLCLMRYFGLMVGDFIPTDNEHWKLYRHLRTINTKRQFVIRVEFYQKHSSLFSLIFYLQNFSTFFYQFL